ncbi:DUF547 domain-containing protein [Aquimarina agarivorans]|uniref:DUF547 domain-containing protein n=1 Tax=Aquimarina agarivorans TaxID=980584 RepID=UPI000248E914|nr:DUF547 domain-containing protein [Aquimarina agarivorans]
MKKISILIVFFITSLGFAQNNTAFFEKADAFFKAYVTNGRVHYDKIKADSTTLNELLAMIAGAKVSKANKNDFQAFYINAYNISVIKGIVDKYPTKSPLNIGGFFDNKNYTVAGQKVSLNGIEKGILFKAYPNEARFHFVLVCAGLGCPPIISKAYKASTLEAQLTKQTKLALNDPNFIRVDGKKTKISQIFEWYAKDFKVHGSVKEFINKYRDTKLPEDTKLSFYTYDWALNKA